MDKAALVADDIVQARRFVDALRAAGLPITVAMWFKKVTADRWSLAIASPDVQEHGPLAVIRFGEAIRRTHVASSIARDDVYFINTSANFMQDIARFPASVESAPAIVESFNLNGADVERAVVVWLDRSAVPSRRPPAFEPGEAVVRKAS